MNVNAARALVFLLILAPPGTSTSETSADETLTLVRKNIRSLPDFGAFDWITCELEGKTIHLSGFASRASLKTSAASAALRVSGVETVANEIEILPESGSDKRIRNRGYVAIYGHPVLQKYAPGGVHGLLTPEEARQGRTFGLQTPPASSGPHPIHLIVKNGHVILLGTVASRADRDLAVLQIRQLFDVLSVADKLRVR